MIGRLALSVARPRYFVRNVSLAALPNGEEITRQTITPYQNFISFEGTRADSLLLIIENGDNPPLYIDSLSGSQQQYFLLTYLEKGRQYRLTAGDPTLKTPLYDLTVSDSISWRAPQIGYSPVMIVPVVIEPKKTSSNTWIWISVLAGIAVLVFLSMSLMKEVKK